MKKILRRSLLLIILLASTFYFGGLLGFSYRQMDDSAANAMLLAQELQQLRKEAESESLSELIAEKEFALDMYLVRLTKYRQQKQIHWLYWPLSSSRDHDAFLRVVAQYRQQHPSSVATLGIDSETVKAIRLSLQATLPERAKTPEKPQTIASKNIKQVPK